jgi:hypothetical protein
MGMTPMKRISVTLTRKISWKFVLPSVMFAATMTLFYLDGIWLRGAAVWDDMPVTTAAGLVVVLNGPATVFNRGAMPVRLLGVVVFWTWIGFLLDRRTRGVQTPVIRNDWRSEERIAGEGGQTPSLAIDQRHHLLHWSQSQMAHRDSTARAPLIPLLCMENSCVE